MIAPKRIGIELLREVRRPSVWFFLSAYALAAGLLALYFEAILSIEAYLQVVYLWMPLLFAPWGARLASRDRERGLAPVLATSPLTHAEEAVARILFMGAFVLATLALTGPITLLAPPMSGDLFAARAARFFAWGLYVGFSSSIAGLIIGAIFSRSPPVVMALGTLSVLGQYIVGAITPILVRMNLPGTGAVFAAFHVVPLLWALEGMEMVEGYKVDQTGILVGATISFLFELLLLVAVMAMQDRSGWSRPRDANAKRGIAATIAGAAICGIVLMVLTPTAVPVEETFAPYFSKDPVEAGEYRIEFSFLNEQGQDASSRFDDEAYHYVALLKGEAATLSITIRGVPNAAVATDSLRLSSRWGSISPTEPVPAAVQLNGTGVGELRLRTHAELAIIKAAFFPVDIELKVDGAPVTGHTAFLYGPVEKNVIWPPPHPAGTVAWSLIAGLVASPTAVLLHRRGNQWSR